MFSWSISKSAEAMFSRWAVKRICKFLLKKKLAKFILGDIDLNQLDVQLGAGTIQLSDLALNVDYINAKLGTTPFLVKEGSVGSLMVTMPWKDGGFRIEVDELEVVLAPRRVKVNKDEPETCSDSKNGNNSSSHGSKKQDNETLSSGVANPSVDVHEGVKTIAKMVKWLLTSFHVKVKKLIMVFDPLLEEDNKKELDRILVLRISEAECGTHISEDASSNSFTTVDNFLGVSQLTNYVKFQGAVLELLRVDGLDHRSPLESETTTGNFVSGHCSSRNVTTIISGENGGFSGNLKLRIPWKNGSLDIHKVDADLHVEPLDLRLQPSAIRCFIIMWDLFKGVSEESKDTASHESSYDFSSASSCMGPSGKGLFGNEGFVTNSCLIEKEPVHSLLSESHLISDWVSRSCKDRNEEELDFGASVDQFFECFDELRNSQSALGSSGMWNWTCSVFSAITAASNLASGSLHVSSEQQHVETKFNASIEKASLLLSFHDEDQKHFSKMTDDEANIDFQTRVCAQFVDLFLAVQIRPLEMNFEVIVQHIQLVEHLNFKNDSLDYNPRCCNDSCKCESALIQKMQDGVQGALLAFQDPVEDPGIQYRVHRSVDLSLNIQDINRCCHMINGKYICGKDASVTLLQTSQVTRCHVRVNLDSSRSPIMVPTLFSLKLPPIVCWVNFDLIVTVLEFLKEMENCIETTPTGSVSVLESQTEKYRSSARSDRRNNLISQSTNVSTKTYLEGNIFMPSARIIFSFPPKKHTDINSNSSYQFIAFDFVSPTVGGEYVRSSKPTPIASPDTATISCSLNFNVGNFYILSIIPAFTEKIVGSETYNRQEASFLVEKIVSVVNRTGHLSLVRMLWQEGPATGPWVAKRAKLLASSENGRREDVRKGCQFASVTTVKDNKNLETRTRKDILSSSAFFLHVQLPPVTINLSNSQYKNIHGLINQMFEHFTCVVSEPVRTNEEHSASQTSILVECESLTVTMTIEPASIGSELPDSWLYLTLQVDKFELLSVFNIGGIRSASFLWVLHGQGSLWGSITEGLHREFLLISCCDSAMGRGGGEGSNVLSSRYSGSDIINFCDPESDHSFTSIIVKGATIVALEGRMDWLTTLFSFFSLPFSELERAGDSSLDKTYGSSLVLNLVDVGLSYEPHSPKLTVNQDADLKSSGLSANEAKEALDVSCMLAASSLKLSNTTSVDCNEGEYKIRLQDLGLLICMVPEYELFDRSYSVDNLSKFGYVKVAEEADTEVIFRTNCENGHAWELECGESHIMLHTCHDTTVGLIRLASEIQKQFAPDLQDYVVHLENRWNNAQQVDDVNDEWTLGGEFSSSLSRTETPNRDKKIKAGNLMDEIREDVFQVSGEADDGHTKFFESHIYEWIGDTIVASEASSSRENVPEFVEEYFVSDLRPISGPTLKSQSSDILSDKTGAVREPQIGTGGWFADTPLRILENYASKVEKIDLRKPVDSEASSSDSDHVDVGKAKGRILLKNTNAVWRMYGGSDWSNFQNTSQVTCSRDVTVCLELVLSGLRFEYDVYDDGEILASRLFLTVQDFCLNDRSNDAPWKLVLGYDQSKHPRSFSSKAVKLNLEAVRPVTSICIEENRLRIAILPMRLHLHQSQLDFLINFFGEKRLSDDSSPNTPVGLSKSGEVSEKIDNLQGHIINEAFLTYFQKFDISPLLIRVDYSPSHVDLTALRGGKYVELVNLVPWKGVELQLKNVHGVGLYGWGSVCETILGEWLEDISQNQIHKLLKGLPPIKSLVAVGYGAAKLVSLPVKNYKKDQKLLKGMQRGTFAFLRSISLEAIGLGVHLAAGTHNVLRQAEHILASIPPCVPWPVETGMGTSVNSNQPNDAQQGIQQACQSISDGLGKSASALVQTPLRKYQRGGSMGSAFVTAVQSAPAAVIAPASGAARAVHCALLGFRNSLDPEHKRESLEKYLGRTPHEFM